jgi:hypothetical protein
MARTPTFAVVPPIPQQGLTEWEFRTLTAIRENIELLTGARGTAAAAVTRGSVAVGTSPAQTMRQVTATGAGYTINDVAVPSLDDYVKLLGNVQQLANDVASLRETVNTLTNQLKG